jgi:hypothetical protein
MVPSGKYDVTIRSIDEFVREIDQSSFPELHDRNRHLMNCLFRGVGVPTEHKLVPSLFRDATRLRSKPGPSEVWGDGSNLNKDC